MTHAQQTPFELIGGGDGVRRLVDRFYSPLAVGVPGTVASFDKAHRLYGAAD